MVVTLQHIWKENYIMSDFKTFGLPDYVIDALQRMNITTPTPIQAEAIPEALKGHDILGSAQTGTGKTLAYIAPLCVYLLEKKNRSAVVLAPTRELAIQVRDMVEKIIGRSQASFKTALLIGGDPMSKQLIQLRKKPQLIIGTPGRINDHLNRQSLALDETQFLVLDETDRMLDMGFSEQLDTIVEAMHPERQTLMFSATMPANIVRISKRYLKDPKRITIGSTTTPVEHITQDVIHTAQSEKFDHLLRELETREGSVIVFVKTKVSCEDIKERLQDANHFAEAIHGDLHQRKRERVVRAFRSNKSRIMVATDVAARGLDVPHVRHVINYDLPQCPEDYIHRIGRTGRAGATGSALCLLSSDDRSKWRAIHNLMNPGKPFSFPKIPGDDRSSQGPKGRGFDEKDHFQTETWIVKTVLKENLSVSNVLNVRIGLNVGMVMHNKALKNGICQLRINQSQQNHLGLRKLLGQLQVNRLKKNLLMEKEIVGLKILNAQIIKIKKAVDHRKVARHLIAPKNHLHHTNLSLPTVNF